MKNLTYIVLAIVFLACGKDCEPDKDGCYDFPPVDELCTAHFSRWFFNQSDNSCAKIDYSGCSLWGFASKSECEECKCK